MIGKLCHPKSSVSASPTRTYVALCNKHDFSGYYFRKFTLPMEKNSYESLQLSGEIENNADFAAWWFLNVLNSVACIDGCIPYEDYSDLAEQPRWEPPGTVEPDATTESTPLAVQLREQQQSDMVRLVTLKNELEQDEDQRDTCDEIERKKGKRR